MFYLISTNQEHLKEKNTICEFDNKSEKSTPTNILLAEELIQENIDHTHKQPCFEYTTLT